MILLSAEKINLFQTIMDIYTKKCQICFNFVLKYELKKYILKLFYHFNGNLER